MKIRIYLLCYMEIEDEFANVASLIGDRVRAILLWSLLDGKAFTATELAISANISRQSVSNHLSKLMGGNLVSVEKQGRHRYFRLADEKIAQVIESMASLIPDQKLEVKKNVTAPQLAFSRTCYDHLAGKLSIQIVTSLIAQKIIAAKGNFFDVTHFGMDWFEKIGINIADLKKKKRSFAHKCLDWTERKHHIAGALGAAILQKFLEQDWVRKKRNTREIIVTPLGEDYLYRELKIKSRYNQYYQ